MADPTVELKKAFAEQVVAKIEGATYDAYKANGIMFDHPDFPGISVLWSQIDQENPQAIVDQLKGQWVKAEGSRHFPYVADEAPVEEPVVEEEENKGVE